MRKAIVKSEPLKQLVGEGRNEKYVRECAELHLAHQGESLVMYRWKGKGLSTERHFTQALKNSTDLRDW